MAGCYGNSAEDRHFERVLDKHLDEVNAADKRAEWIEQRVKDMMADGQEYYPFKPAHVTEALSELCFADEILLASYVSSAFRLQDNTSALVNLADFVVDRVQDYWHGCAVKKAKEEYDKAGF